MEPYVTGTHRKYHNVIFHYGLLPVEDAGMNQTNEVVIQTNRLSKSYKAVDALSL
jgi:hypothetical protein